jgi:hypothetical protein
MNNKGQNMKQVYAALKILAVGLFATAMSACSTVNVDTKDEWTGKVWRAVVVKPFMDTTTYRPTDAKWIAKTEFDEKRDQGVRVSFVHFSSGWNSIMTTAMVPDQLEFSQIPKGTLVDVIVEPGPDINYAKPRFSRILRVVCAKNDDKCFDTEHAAKRVRAVVDENPGDLSATDGLTFKRRITKEELKEFK